MKKFHLYLAQQAVDAPKESQGSSSSLFDHLGIFILVGTFFLMYFFMIRPQRREERRKKEMLSSLKKGDAVITTSGILATVVSVKEDKVLLNIGDNTRVEFLRSAIASTNNKLPSISPKTKG